MEHRWGQRFAVDLPIRMTLPLLGAQHARLTNLSLSGGFITTLMTVRVLSRLQVLIELPGDELQEAASIAAYVIRKADQGIGVEWCEFAPVALAAILRDPTLCLAQRDRRQVAREPVAPMPEMPSDARTRRLKHGS